jgi:hypothetical protein
VEESVTTVEAGKRERRELGASSLELELELCSCSRFEF